MGGATTLQLSTFKFILLLSSGKRVYQIQRKEMTRWGQLGVLSGLSLSTEKILKVELK
jgi:hypothetical protein